MCVCVCASVFGYFLHACWANKVLLCQQMVKGFFIVFRKHFIHCEQWPRLFEFHTICKFYSSPCEHCEIGWFRNALSFCTWCCVFFSSVVLCIFTYAIRGQGRHEDANRSVYANTKNRWSHYPHSFVHQPSKLECILSDYIPFWVSSISICC